MKGILENFCTKFIHSTGTGETDWASGRQCFRVPASLDTKATVSLVSERWGGCPDCLPPLSQAAERTEILSLISMLNGAFDLGLSTGPSMERSSKVIRIASRKIGFRKLLAVVGGSHVAQLAEQLMAKEAQVFELTQPGWDVCKRSVELVIGELTVLTPATDVILLQCLDNSAYFCQNEDSSSTLLVKAISDGKYHMVGDLRIATKEQVNNLYKMLKPLCSTIPGAEVILVSRIPRYIYKLW